MSRSTKPGTTDAAPEPAGHAPVAVGGYCLDVPPPPPPPPPAPQLVLGDGPVLWRGRIPKDPTARVLVFRGPDHPMEASLYYLKALGALASDKQVEVQRLDAVPDGWADPPGGPTPLPTLAPEFSPNAAPPPTWARSRR